MKKISVAIPYYNNSKFMRETLSYPVLDERISEIIICDDKSDDLDILKNIISEFNSDKIKLIENEDNLGVYLNKIRAIKNCSNDWVILFDSDNVIGENYINHLYEFESWEDDKIYAPGHIEKINENGRHDSYFDYRIYSGVINKSNFNQFDYSNSLFQTMMNTCNYFLNKNKYIECSEKNSPNYDTRLISSLDSITLLSDWLTEGNQLVLVRDMGYKHRIHGNSSYMRHMNKINEPEWTRQLFQKIMS